ncbi:MAG: redoxin domain-containing protein [Dissulfurispiraceae bacterium]
MRESFKKRQRAKGVGQKLEEDTKGGKSVFYSLLFTFCFLPLAFSLLPLADSVIYAGPPSPFDGEKNINQQAPEFALKDINGNTLSLSSYKGRVVLLNFWATWCPSCREEMPSLNKLSQKLKNRNFSIIEVSADRSVSDVKDYLRKHPSDCTVVVDDSLSVSRSLYKVFVLPTSFLIDKKGIIVKKYYGGEDWDGSEMVSKIESLL